MANLLPILSQIILDDPASILAFVVMVYAAGSAAYNLYYTYHWWRTSHRSFIYAGTTVVRIAVTIGYAVILFINPLASVALLRPLFLLAMILHDIMTNRVDTIERYDPSELAQQQIEKLRHDEKTHLQNLDTWRTLVNGYREREQLWNQERAKMTADTKTIVEALEGARAELARVSIRLIEADEVALKQETAVNTLKQQVVVMELELRRVKGRE